MDANLDLPRSHPRKHATSRLTVKLFQLVLLLALFILYCLTVQAGMRYPATTDFAKFYATAQFLRVGEDVYAPVAIDALGPLPPDAEFTRSTLHPNLNLPLITALFAPFAWGSYSHSFLLWSALSLLCGVAAILLAAATSEGQQLPMKRAVWLIILLLAYFPTWATVKLGQVSLLLFLLLVVGWGAARRGKDSLAGVAIGLALLLKPFVFVLIPFFLARGRWRLAGWSLGVFAGGILLSLLLFGLDVHRTYATILGEITWYGANWNASLLGFFTRTFGGSENVPAITAPWLARGLAYAISLVLLALLVWLAWRSRKDSEFQSFDLGFGLSLAIMLLATPLGWMYYFPMLFIAYFTAWPAIRDENKLWLKVVFLAAFVMGTAPTPLVPSSEMNSPVAWFTWAAVYCYALVLLTAVLAHLLRRTLGKL